MPKTAASIVTWLSRQGNYELQEREGNTRSLLQNEDEAWFTWLKARSSFAFRGKQGHLTLRKETRPHGEAYWYAYRNQGRRTSKKYAGRTSDLTLARLETIASSITSTELTHTTPPISTPDTRPFHGYKKDALLRTPREVHLGTATETTGIASSQPAFDSPLLAPKLSLPRLPGSLWRNSNYGPRMTCPPSECYLPSAPC